MTSKLSWLVGVAAAALIALLAPAQSQTYPSQPITVTLPFAPGGSADLTVRVVSEKISAKLGQPVVVENRPGAGGELAAMSVVRAAPDGYRLLATSNGPVVVIGNFRTINYNPETDLVPVAMLVKVPAAIAVNATLPIHSIADLVSYSKKMPGGLNYGNAGVGTHMHLSGEIFRAKTGANLTAVPYRGTALIALAVKTGEIPMGVADLTSLMPFGAEGSLRILALVDSKRSSVAPHIRTVAESGVPGFGVDAWIGLFAPKGTSSDIAAKLNFSINETLALPDVRQRLVAAGLDPWQLTPQEMSSFIKTDLARWSVLLREANVKIQ
jgi:tripartite-type tricarboxylate transporter receptor subunit TctC